MAMQGEEESFMDMQKSEALPYTHIPTYPYEHSDAHTHRLTSIKHMHTDRAIRSSASRATPKLSRTSSGIAADLSFEDLKPWFRVSLNRAAVGIGICVTKLKRVCRKNGISKWPYRQLKNIETSIRGLEQALSMATSEAEKEQVAEQIQALGDKRTQLLETATCEDEGKDAYEMSQRVAHRQSPSPVPRVTPTPSSSSISDTFTNANPSPMYNHAQVKTVSPANHLWSRSGSGECLTASTSVSPWNSSPGYVGAYSLRTQEACEMRTAHPLLFPSVSDSMSDYSSSSVFSSNTSNSTASMTSFLDGSRPYASNTSANSESLVSLLEASRPFASNPSHLDTLHSMRFLGANRSFWSSTSLPDTHTHTHTHTYVQAPESLQLPELPFPKLWSSNGHADMQEVNTGHPAAYQFLPPNQQVDHWGPFDFRPESDGHGLVGSSPSYPYPNRNPNPWLADVTLDDSCNFHEPPLTLSQMEQLDMSDQQVQMLLDTIS